MQSKITLLAMYNYNNSLFDKLSFPAGINRDLAIKRILNKSEEFEILYSDFEYLKDRIGIWGEIWERTFKKWVDDLSLEYDPLYNYDRHEIYTDTKSREYSDITNNSSESISNTVTGSTSSSGTEQQVSGYDQPGYSPSQKDDSSATSSQTGSGDAKSTSSNDSSGDSNEIMQHEAHLFGNIGVTTSVQMLTEDLKIAEWNLYEHISDIFIDEFCILVY